MNEPQLIKKVSLTDKVIEKQTKILIIAIVCVLTLFIGSSYALLTNFDKTDNVINFTTGNLNMTVTNSGDSLTLTELNGKLPENDETGLENANPIVLTLTNTGTMFIGGYDVKLTNDPTKTSTLNADYIKYAISEDGISYSTPEILTSNDNIIFTGYNLDVNKSKKIYLKVWIDEAAGNNALNKEYYGSIQVEIYQKNKQPSYEMVKSIAKFKQTSSCKTYVEEDGTTYISGTKSCIDFNYVWYSGKLWRITAINPDGTMKMITNDLITAIAYGPDNEFYTNENTTSYIYQWLNQEFLPTLYNYQNIIIENAIWNASPGNGEVSTKLPVEGQEEVLVNASVGLLNSYEYYKSYQNTSNYSYSGYLNIRYYWWLLNPYNANSSSYVWIEDRGSASDGISYFESLGVRPVVSLKSTIELSSGSGTINDPYRIKGDQEETIPNVTLLNTRQSGEYVKFINDYNAPIFRIVGIETINGTKTTKLVSNDYVKDTNDLDNDNNTSEVLTRAFGNTFLWNNISETDPTYWRGYLNSQWIKEIDSTYNSETGTSNILAKGIYYLGSVTSSNNNYKLTVCKTPNNRNSVQDCINSNTVENPTVQESVTEYSGLLRYGETFATQIIEDSFSAKEMWFVTPSAPSHVWFGRSGGEAMNSPQSAVNGPDYAMSSRPTINLKSNIVIKSGSGTKNAPYIVGLPG